MENLKEAEILLVEDNPNDMELTLRAMSTYNLANKIHVAKDGVEALEYVFNTGAYSERDIKDKPQVILLDPNPDIENGRTTSMGSLGIFFQSAVIVSCKLPAQLQKQPRNGIDFALNKRSSPLFLPLHPFPA